MFAGVVPDDATIFPDTNKRKVTYDFYECGYEIARDEDGNLVTVPSEDGNSQLYSTTGGFASMEHMFEGAFASPNMAEGSYVTFHKPLDGIPNVGTTSLDVANAQILSTTNIANASYLFFAGTDTMASSSKAT